MYPRAEQSLLLLYRSGGQISKYFKQFYRHKWNFKQCKWPTIRKRQIPIVDCENQMEYENVMNILSNPSLKPAGKKVIGTVPTHKGYQE